MKEALVKEIVENEQTLHPGLDVGDFMRAQDYAHQHSTALARDLLVAGAPAPQVAGFNHSFAGGMTVNINVPGHIVTDSGKSFQLLDPEDFVALTFAEADQANPRIDVVYALLIEAEEMVDEFRSFRQAGQNAVQRNTPTERWNNALVQVKQGTAAAVPAPAALGVNEVALYLVRVQAGAQELLPGDVSDVRTRPRSLVQLAGDVSELASRLPGVKPTYTASEILLGAGAGPYESRSVEAFVDDYVQGGSGIALPEILTPELSALDANAGKLGTVGEEDGGVPVVDIPAGRRVVFVTGARSIAPDKFPPEVNARVISKAVSAGTETQSNQINFNLGAVSMDQTDAPPSVAQRNASLEPGRFNPAMAGRGTHFVEIFGGSYGLGGLSDWHTYDTLADTLTPRNFTGSIPAQGIASVMISCGINSDNILLFSGGNWYKLNAATGVSTALVGGPAGMQRVLGDLIQPDLILLLVMNNAQGTQPTGYWTFRPSTDTFTQLVVTGQTPVTDDTQNWNGCMYAENKFVVVGVDPVGPVPRVGATWLFDFPTLTWTKLSGKALPELESTTAKFYFQNNGMEHVNGRVLLIGGTSALDHEWAFELVPSVSPAWRRLPDPNTVPQFSFGMGSLRDISLSGSVAIIAGGYTPGPQSIEGDRRIYATVPGGLVETQYLGGPAITLAPGAAYAVFHMANINLPWEADSLIASLVGSFPAGSVKLEYSFDGGVSYQVVPPYVSEAIANSATPAVRALRITLFNPGGAAPVLKSLNELFHEAGGSSFDTNELVLRFNAIVTEDLESRWLRMDAEGNLTFASVASPSTPGSAVLVRVTPTSPVDPPNVKDYRNQRHSRRLKRGTRAAGATPPIVWDFGGMPSYLEAIKVLADGSLKDLLHATAFPNPIVFDQDIDVGGIGVDGDGYRVELET